MIGKKLSVKETNHKARILLISGGITIALSILFFLISTISGTGVNEETKKKKTEKTRVTEGNDIVLYDPDK